MEGESRDVCTLSTSCFTFISSQTAVSADFSVCAFLFIFFVFSLLFYSIYFGVFCSVKWISLEITSCHVLLFLVDSVVSLLISVSFFSIIVLYHIAKLSDGI